MTSFQVNYVGGKVLRFHDGQTIRCNIPSDQFNSVVTGTIYRQVHGTVEYVDEENQLHATVTIGKVKKKSQEYFEGSITHKGQHVCEVYGNYCGYIDFDGVRYWDNREVDKVWKEYTPLPQDKILPSDSIFRKDVLTLKTGDVDQA